MFTIDERLRGLPAVKEQVVQLYQSLNAPNLAVPGRRAGPATAFVLGLRGPTGFAVFVYLYLPESQDCAVYVPAAGTVPAEAYQSEEAEALSFVESLGFIMDNLNFRGRPGDEQELMIQSLPVFQREPPPAPVGIPGSNKAATGKSAGVVTLGKLFSAFCLAALASGCVTTPSAKDKDDAYTHYQLAVNALVTSPQVAMREVDEALKLDPTSAEAWHVKALLYHHSFARLEEAQQAYAKALTLKPDFPDCVANLGNLYLDQKRYDDAIAQYEKALSNIMYLNPFIAQANLGWALFQKGDTEGAIRNIKAATILNPKFCLAYSQLGTVYASLGDEQESCKYVSRYREHCPSEPDALMRDGKCLARTGEKAKAAKAFEACSEKARNDDLKDLCRSLRAELGLPAEG